MKLTVDIDILVGLPASGKTYYANNSCDTYNSIIDFDYYKDTLDFSLKHVLEHKYLYNEIFKYYNERIYMIFDGLFTTKESQENIVDKWMELVNKSHKKIQTNINFVYFIENREVCLHNDSFRPEDRQAAVTISHLPLDKPDVAYFTEKYKNSKSPINFSITEREIYKLTIFQDIINNNRDKYWSEKLNKDIMTSEKWCTGGTICCWDGSEYNCSPEKQPTSFVEFDKLLEKYCPDIPFLKYKSIYNECVTIEEDYEYDYYGGCENFNIYCCDLNRLFELLVELGYITEK